VALPSLAGLVAVVLHRNGWIDVVEAISLLVGGAIAVAVPSVWVLASRSGPERHAVQSADEAAAQLAREVAAREPGRPRVHYLQLLHDLDSIAWEADPATGQLKFASPRMRSLLSAAADVSPAETEFWTRIAHAPDRARVASTLSTAAMESRDCELEFQASTAAGTRFLRARFYPVHEGSPPRWARGVVFDLTDAKGRDRFVAVQTDVARVLDGSPSVAVALPRLLGVLGQALEWDAGAAWTLDLSLGALRCVESWQASPDIAVELIAASCGETCRRGEDLPGRVWANGVAAWSAELGRESKSRRAAVAAADGVKSAVGFPIRARGEVLGVAELFSRKDKQPDENVSAFLSAVGDLIGIFIDHRRTEERQREESAALEAVNKLAPMLSGKLDVDQVIQELTDAATRLASAASGTFFYHSPGSEGDGYRSYTSTAAPRDSFGLAVPRPAGFPTRLFSSDGPLRIDDARRGASTSWSESPLPGAPIASYLAVPVVSRSGRVLGGLALSHPDPGVFTDREERIVLAIAAQAAVAIDNAELYATERQARQAAETASRAKDEFLAMLGHELRNPIGAIRNSVDTLSAAYGRNGDAAGEMLTAIISRQTEALAQLVDDLLDVTRLISGKMRLRKRVVDLSEFTGRALEALCAGGRAAQHSVRFDGEPVFVEGDPVRLEQIVTNLVDNALKYTPPGGEIAIAVERTGEVAQLRVRDNGQGIDPELLPRIFDLFAQGRQSLDRPHGGLGIGLTLVRRLAELHGGTVEVESAGSGRGSEFRVRLPARASSEGAAVEEAPGPRWMTPRHVLIAEDHADSRESLRLLLEASGHRVDVARGGDDAVELALSGSPELALIDIGLPGLDGYDVAREIRASDTSDSIYLVALTGYGQPLDRRRALRCGFNEHVVKPLTREKLLRLMATLDSPERRVAS